MNRDDQTFVESTLETVYARITQVELMLSASKSIGYTENNDELHAIIERCKKLADQMQHIIDVEKGTAKIYKLIEKRAAERELKDPEYWNSKVKD